MRFTTATIACLLGSAVASPMSPDVSLATRNPPFSDASCQLSIVPSTPFTTVFPTANALGLILGPILKGLIGVDNLEAIDATADFLCVYVAPGGLFVNMLYTPSLCLVGR